VKILLYTHSFAPEIGGVETYVKLLAHGLSVQHRRRLKVTVVTPTPSNGRDDDELPFRLVRQPSLWALWRELRDADVVHLAGPVFMPLLLGLLRRKPLVVEHHGYQAICPNGLLFHHPTQAPCPGHFQARRYGACLGCQAASAGWWKSLAKLPLTFLRRLMCRLAAANVAVSAHVLSRLDLPRAKVIYHGVPDLAAGPPSSPPAIPCFAYVGRLVHEKGPTLLLEAARRLKEQELHFRLKFIGGGPDLARLEALTEQFALQSHVAFTGLLNPPELFQALEDTTALVMPSVCEETSGIAAMEQMMRGRMVIAADIGGLGEIVDGAALKFPPGDAAALAVCLRRALDEPALATVIGQTARARALRLFKEERMVIDHLRLYEEVRLWKG
jgi:glycosyltransferase involved in cell wall biosynthesis